MLNKLRSGRDTHREREISDVGGSGSDGGGRRWRLALTAGRANFVHQFPTPRLVA